MTKQQINCEQALRQVFEYIDRELAADDHQAMQRHLHACHSCFSRVEFEQRLKGKLGELTDEQVGPEINDRIKALLKSF